MVGHNGRLPMRHLLICLSLLSCVPAAAQKATWHVLRPQSAESSKGATLTIADDGSVIASGENPDLDTYVIRGTSKLTEITGIRIEALPDASLPKRGPGRAANGNFVLTRVQMETASRLSTRRTIPAKFANAVATWSQSNYPVTGVLDAGPKTGWAINPRVGKAASAVLTTAGRIRWKAGVHVKLTLRFQYGTKHTLGKFRISVTDSANPGAGVAAAGEPWARTQGKINKAIDRGIEWLMRRQYLDGSFPDHTAGYPTGSTALAVYTMIKSGVRKDHLAVQKAIRFLRCHRPTKTYAIACQVLAFTALGEEQDDERIKRMVAELIDIQHSSGGWAYPHGAPDLSNTQYAALALHMAAKRGIKIPRRVWIRLADKVLKHVRPDGKGGYAAVGYSYRPKGKATGSMTSAGVGTLAICDLNLKPRRNDVTVSVKRGVQWLGRYFSASSNMFAGDDRWVFYYLYGLERAGGLTGERMFGPHDWYRAGARWLIKKQAANGSWSARAEHSTNTCFALLFLSKATGSVTGGQASGARVFGYEDKKKAVSIRASGERPLAMWIVRFGDKALKENAWPGEAGKGLHVETVEYLGGRRKDMKGAKLLQKIGRDPRKPHHRDALSAQHEFPHPGSWWIQARVTVRLLGLEAGKVGRAVVLKSDPVQVTVWDVAGSQYLDYGDDSTRNLLRGATVSASSEHNNNWLAQHTVDGQQIKGWLTKDDHPKPTIKFRLPSAKRADTLLLSHAVTGGNRRSRIAKVEVKVNGAFIGTVNMIRDDRRKTVFTFPKMRSVKTLELKVVDTHIQGQKGVGFAEVELQNRSRRR